MLMLVGLTLVAVRASDLDKRLLNMQASIDVLMEKMAAQEAALAGQLHPIKLRFEPARLSRRFQLEVAQEASEGLDDRS